MKPFSRRLTIIAKHRPWKIDPSPSPEVDLYAALADVNPLLSWENGDFDEIPAEK